MARTVRARMADSGWRVPRRLRGSGMRASSCNRLSGAGMQQPSYLGDDLPCLVKFPPHAKIKLRTALRNKAHDRDCSCTSISSWLLSRRFGFFSIASAGVAMCRCLGKACAGVLILAVAGCTLDSFLLPGSVVYGPKLIVAGTVGEVSARLQDGLSDAGIMVVSKRVGDDFRIGGKVPK